MMQKQPDAPAAKIKVAQVVETMTMGGAENLAVRIANALPAQGFESHLIVMTEPGVLSERVDPVVKVHYLGFTRASIRNPIAFPYSILSGFRRLSGLIRKEGIGLVQTHLPGANFWGLLLALMNVCRVLATIHNNREFEYGDVDSPWRSRIRRWAYRAIVNRCDGTIAVSEAVKLSLVRDLDLDEGAGSRISVVTNGVSLSEPIAGLARESVRLELGVEPDVPFLLAAGRFGPQKNFGDLMKVASRLKEREIRFCMVVAGEGEFLEDLRAQIPDLGLEGRVLMPGNLTNLGQVMQAADVFVMTSLWEGLPLVLLEAMAAGLPAVAYAIAGVNELVSEGETGHLVSLGDTDGFAERLGNLADQPGRGRAMGQKGRLRIQADFNFHNLIKKLSQIYSDPPS